MLRAPHPLRRMLCTSALVALVGGLCASAGHAEDSGVQSTRLQMREIFARMEVLIPLSVDDDAFRDPKNAARIHSALADLAGRIGEVSQHASGADRRIHYLAGSLERETRDTLERFDAGRTDSAQFFVQRLTDFCIACHTRLPSPQDSPLAEDFVSDGELAKLPLERRAALQIATRRFSDALTTLEELIDSSTEPAAALLDPVTRYLTVSIRVKNDLKRPLPTLRKLAQRPDLWSHLRSDVREWIAALERHSKDPSAPPSLSKVRAILDEARAQIRFPSDRRALVHYLLASSELNRFLERHKGESGPEMAEAFYLLGLVESRVSADYWVSESQFYLETAVRLAPGTEVGRRAFDLLEEETVLGWSGSGGIHIPADVQAQLDELRVLVEGNEGGSTDAKK